MQGRRVLGLSVVVVLVGALLTTGLLANPTSAASDDADEVLLVEPNGRWHIRVPGEPDYTFWYGLRGDVALFGDWDGDGFDSPGMYRPSTGFVYLTNVIPLEGAVGFGDPALTYYFGNPGDQVFVGDWDGNGTDTLGISRNGKMFLTNTHGTAAAEDEFWFGFSTDIAFGGHPDGVGGDSVFLHRPSSGFVYYTTEIPTGNVAATAGEFFFGDPGDRLVIGDWDGDGRDTAGLFRASNSSIHLRNTLNTGPADTSYNWGGRTWVPVAGKFNLPPTYVLRTGAGSVDGVLLGSVSSDPPGIICVHSCSADCIERYPAGTEVTLTAHMDEEKARFVEWTSGDCGSANPCTIIMNADLTVFPIWEWWPPEYRVEVTPAQGGTINSDPGGINNCSVGNIAGCVFDFPAGSIVTLTASPDEGFTFTGWSGDTCVGRTGDCTLFFIQQDYQIAATFTPNTASLPIRVNAGGPALAALDGGPIWMDDRQSSPSTFVNFQAGDPENLTVEWERPTIGDSVPATTPGEVFASERYDNPGGTEMHWNFPLESDQWVEVRLYFASGFPGASDLAERLFDVSIDDWLVLDDYDIVADVGHQVGVMKRFIVKPDADGLDVVFTHLDPAVQNPLINAIEIVEPERLMVVSPMADAELSGSALLTAIASVNLQGPAQGSEWIVKIQPGEYELADTPLVMVPYVELEGSGQASTILRRSGQDATEEQGVVVGADHAVLRHVKVERLTVQGLGPSNRLGILNENASPRIEAVTIEVLAGCGPSGISNRNAAPIFRDITIITDGRSCGAGTTGVFNEESDVTITNFEITGLSDWPGSAFAIYSIGGTLTLTHGTIDVPVTGWGGRGITTFDSATHLKDVVIHATGGWHVAYGVSATASTVEMENVSISVSVDSVVSYGVTANDSTITMTNVTVTNTSGGPPYAVYLENTDATLANVELSSSEPNFNTGWGVYNVGDGSFHSVLVDSSTIRAPSSTVRNDAGITTVVTNSILDGGPVVGTVTCQNVWDENGTFYADTCPG